MDDKTVILIAIGAVLFLFLIRQLLRSKAPLRTGFVSMLIGAAALTATNMLGLAISINLFSVMISLTLGIPGVVMILILAYFI